MWECRQVIALYSNLSIVSLNVDLFFFPQRRKGFRFFVIAFMDLNYTTLISKYISKYILKIYTNRLILIQLSKFSWQCGWNLGVGETVWTWDDILLLNTRQVYDVGYDMVLVHCDSAAGPAYVCALYMQISLVCDGLGQGKLRFYRAYSVPKKLFCS
jgi:hypothetical protein